MKVVAKNSLISVSAEAISHIHNLIQKDSSVGFFETYGIFDPEPSFVNNFKDALYHVDNLNSVDDDGEVLLQFKCFDEHLRRGVIDYYVEVFQNASRYYYALLKCFTDDQGIHVKNKSHLMECYRKNSKACFEVVHEMRTTKMNLFDFTDLCNPKFNAEFFSHYRKGIQVILSTQLEIHKQWRNSGNPRYMKNVNAVALTSASINGAMIQVTGDYTISELIEESGLQETHFREINSDAIDYFQTNSHISYPFWYVVPSG